MTRRLLDRLERRKPEWIRRVQCQLLLNVTARAFRVRRIRVWRHSADRALREYAAFTARCMRQSAASPQELYDRAYALGERVRRLSGLKEPRDLERLVFYLYGNIAIQMSGHIPGEITVSRCYFSQCYTPRFCALMSHVDSGVIAGLFGGGELRFTRRITEGCAECSAIFQNKSKEGHT